MVLYHGSEKIIQTPEFGKGKRVNDYGRGFYCTEDRELAKEWACGRGKNGFANAYELDLQGLSILNLNSREYTILNWLAVLARYRTYWQKGSIAEEAKKYLQDHFFVDTDACDLIVGYRADDSYFSFAQDFVSGAISYRKLTEAMHLGRLGEQVVLKSRKAFEQIRFTGFEKADAKEYFYKKLNRDKAARRKYRMNKTAGDTVHDLYMLDIMREGMKNDDPRLR